MQSLGIRRSAKPQEFTSLISKVSQKSLDFSHLCHVHKTIYAANWASCLSFALSQSHSNNCSYFRRKGCFQEKEKEPVVTINNTPDEWSHCVSVPTYSNLTEWLNLFNSLLQRPPNECFISVNWNKQVSQENVISLSSLFSGDIDECAWWMCIQVIQLQVRAVQQNIDELWIFESFQRR